MRPLEAFVFALLGVDVLITIGSCAHGSVLWKKVLVIIDEARIVISGKEGVALDGVD